jgi:hypothetical protein
MTEPNASIPARDTTWQDQIRCRYGSAASAVLGWWETLEADDAANLAPQDLYRLCNSIQLVPVLAELGDIPEDVVLERQLMRAGLPEIARLIAWVDGAKALHPLRCY